MIITHSIAQYIEKNSIRKNVRWIVVEDKFWFELVHNVWCSEDIFNDIFPLYEYVKFNDKGSNPDKTRIV